MPLETNLEASVKELAYAKNHHWLKLTDKKGDTTVLVEQALIRYRCGQCPYEFYSKSNLAKCCAACSSTMIDADWTRPQISLVPEKESDFTMSPKEDKDE